SMRDATKAILQKDKELKKHVDSTENYAEKFYLCYSLYEKIGFSCQCDIVEETEERLIVKVTECPHHKYTKNNPVACSACMGLKLGILESLFGIHLPTIKRYASMAMGDQYCMFEIPKLKKEDI
ncbi:MAG: methanogen output domain 1-containing protein, partial [Methanosarcinales archaeon]